MGDPDDDVAPADLPDRLRRRLDDVFGDVFPDVTRDEAPDFRDEQPGDEWLRRNRPPHHGGA